MKKAGRLSIIPGPERLVLTVWPENGAKNAENSIYLPLSPGAAAMLVAHLGDWLDSQGHVSPLHLEFDSDGAGTIIGLHVAERPK